MNEYACAAYTHKTITPSMNNNARRPVIQKVCSTISTHVCSIINLPIVWILIDCYLNFYWEKNLVTIIHMVQVVYCVYRNKTINLHYSRRSVSVTTEILLKTHSFLGVFYWDDCYSFKSATVSFSFSIRQPNYNKLWMRLDFTEMSVFSAAVFGSGFGVFKKHIHCIFLNNYLS